MRAGSLLVLALPVSLGQLFKSSRNVYELDAQRVEAEVAESRSPWVMMYYADWCPHCHHYAPIFERIAGQISPLHQGAVSFGAVNCPDFTAFCTKIQIQGYPTVRTYHFTGDVGASLAGKTPDRHIVHSEAQFTAWITRNAPVVESNASSEQTKVQEPSVSNSSQELRGQNTRGALKAKEAEELQKPWAHEVLPDAMAAMRLADAEVALLYSLRQGTFLKGSNGELKGDSLVELLRWLDYLARTFPGGRKQLRQLAEATHQAVSMSSAGNALSAEAFGKLLDNRGLDRIPAEAGHKPEAYWRKCRSYTCSLWTLFHVLSVSEAKSAAPETAGQDLLARMRGFVAFFFGCDYCRDHFLEAFDSCKLGRCKLSAEDVSGAALWIWQMHNDVTLRVAAENFRPIPTLWPPEEDCPECWDKKSPSGFNSAAVLAHLSAEYGSAEWHEDTPWLSGAWTAHGAVPLALVSALILAFGAFKLMSRSSHEPAARGKDTKGS